jgi:hypothetical protein
MKAKGVTKIQVLQESRHKTQDLLLRIEEKADYFKLGFFATPLTDVSSLLFKLTIDLPAS